MLCGSFGDHRRTAGCCRRLGFSANPSWIRWRTHRPGDRCYVALDLA